MTARAALALLALAPLAACDRDAPAAPDAARDTRAPAADGAAEGAAREGEGCARGSTTIDAIERDASCIVDAPERRDAQSALRGVQLAAKMDAAAIVPGGSVNLRVTITNTGRRERPIVLEARPPAATARPDWSRLAGIPPPQGTTTESYRVSFGVHTVDARNFPVDRLPVVPPPSEPPVRWLRVRLAPGATLTYLAPWWALGIPAPYPPFKDDAGHRIVPQTAPRPLAPGDYTVNVEIPLYGLASNERTVATTAHVAVEDPP